LLFNLRSTVIVMMKISLQTVSQRGKKVTIERTNDRLRLTNAKIT
jgi:hypothetical protein